MLYFGGLRGRTSACPPGCASFPRPLADGKSGILGVVIYFVYMRPSRHIAGRLGHFLNRLALNGRTAT